MGDEIKRALVKAQANCHNYCRADEPCACRTDAAIIIAAFLTAMHEIADGAHVEYGAGRTVWVGEFDGVAAAVTRAAEGSGE